ncbi:MAG: hypothetical protein ACK44D_12755, partial [Bacteroidia bacterium]
MKFLAIVFAFFTSALYAQHNNTSLNLKLHLKSSESAAQRADFGKAQQHYISTFIKVQQPFNEKPLLALGAKIGTRAGDVYTVQVPEKQLPNLTQLKGILYVQLDEPIATNMDPARRSSRVDSVQRGINLPLAYTG